MITIIAVLLVLAWLTAILRYMTISVTVCEPGVDKKPRIVRSFDVRFK
jgi:hypothetical protein